MINERPTTRKDCTRTTTNVLRLGGKRIQFSERPKKKKQTRVAMWQPGLGTCYSLLCLLLMATSTNGSEGLDVVDGNALK